MGLAKYRAKRQFDKTPEPKGKTPQRHKKLAFVVQEHRASRLHYDFRLELDGVLKSWAVPKGPSLNPHEHHLAIHVEDHPYEYRTFEGIIPEGHYGAGEVIIWDEGTYEPRAASDNPEATLREEYKKGHITFVVHGKKLNGEFALIKFHGPKAEENAWLLVKKGDEFASTTDVTRQARSVKSGKRVEELGVQVPDTSQYPKVAKPWPVTPMLCTLVTEAFSKDDWLFEIKWDGYRAVADKRGQEVHLYSRNAQNFAENYPPVYEAIHELEHDVILDGEIVVVDEHGAPHFEALQGWRHHQQASLRYYVFDILWYDGHDVRTMPLKERKKLLQTVIPADSLIRYSDHVAADGLGLFREMRSRGLEGIVAKQAGSIYQENVRGAAWLKIKTHLRQEVVIGGFTEPRGGRKYLGSLVVGVYEKGELVYVGHSGGGIPDKLRKELRTKLDRLKRSASPFRTTPKTNAPAHWVKPELVCEMSFSEWTSEGSMRHPVFVGMRTDKKPSQVHREKAKPAAIPTTKEKPMPASSDKLSLTHLDKIFFPKHKYTKGDLIEYYRSVADFILPYLKDRPLSLLRQPEGVKGPAFFQKNFEHLPGWVPAADIYSESNQADMHWIVGGTLDTLLYVVQLGSIEINPWNSRIQNLDKPDWAVIDLDPEGIGFKQVIAVAQTVKKVCDEWGIQAVPKTSGKTGIHIFIPLGAAYTHEQAKNFAHLFALEVNKRQPKITSVLRMPDKRKHKIYVDFLQNREGQTLAAPYCVRPTADATVSTPLHWDEVVPSLKPTDFTIKNTAKRLARVGDLWKPVLGKGVNLADLLSKLEPPE